MVNRDRKPTARRQARPGVQMANQDGPRPGRNDPLSAGEVDKLSQDLRGNGTETPGLSRVTVNLTPRSMQALDRVSVAVGESKTDAINRALQVYAFLREVLDQES